MWREAGSWRALVRASARLLRLELRLMTGGRALVVLGAQLAWLAGMAIWQRFQDEPWEAVSNYNRMILLPCLLPAIAMGMSCILAERDERHLEMSFASPGGRYLLWSFRLAAIAAASAVACLVLATGTWLGAAREIPPLHAAVHALVPVFMAACLASALALLFNGTASSGLVTAGLLALAAFVHVAAEGGDGAAVSPIARFDPFLNPFDPPGGLQDPQAFLRVVMFNRLFLLSVTGACLAVTMGLLQRRERLL